MNISSDYSSATLQLYTKVGNIARNETDSSSAGVDFSGNCINQLKSKFPELNILAGNYTGGQTGSGVQGNVLISPQLIKKMENDPELAAKIENDLSGIPAAEEWLKNQCAAKGMTLVAGGTMIDEDGNMSSWSLITSESSSADEESEDDEKRIEKKKEEMAMAARLDEKKAMKEQADAIAREPTSYYSEYDGIYEKLLSTEERPYSFSVYA